LGVAPSVYFAECLTFARLRPTLKGSVAGMAGDLIQEVIQSRPQLLGGQL
jgi:hypothetical protein